MNVRTDPTLNRIPTDAVGAYRDIITGNGVPADYLPLRPPTDCRLVDPPASCATPLTAP